MAEREFKRKRKPSKAQAGPPALKLITSRSNDISRLYISQPAIWACIILQGRFMG